MTAGRVQALKSFGYSDAEIFDIAAIAASRSFFTKLLDALGVEPEDIETLSTELTETVENKVGPIMDLVLAELEQLGVTCKQGVCEYVSRDPLYDRKN